MKNKYKVIAKAKSQTKKVTCKYVIEVLRKVTHTYELNKGNSNTLSSDAIKK